MFSNMPEWDENFFKKRYLRNDKTFDYCFIYRVRKNQFITSGIDNIPNNQYQQTNLPFPPGLTRGSC